MSRHVLRHRYDLSPYPYVPSLLLLSVHSLHLPAFVFCPRMPSHAVRLLPCFALLCTPHDFTEYVIAPWGARVVPRSSYSEFAMFYVTPVSAPPLLSMQAYTDANAVVCILTCTNVRVTDRTGLTLGRLLLILSRVRRSLSTVAVLISRYSCPIYYACNI